MGDSIQMEMTNVSKFLIFHNGLRTEEDEHVTHSPRQSCSL